MNVSTEKINHDTFDKTALSPKNKYKTHQGHKTRIKNHFRYVEYKVIEGSSGSQADVNITKIQEALIREAEKRHKDTICINLIDRDGKRQKSYYRIEQTKELKQIYPFRWRCSAAVAGLLGGIILYSYIQSNNLDQKQMFTDKELIINNLDAPTTTTYHTLTMQNLRNTLLPFATLAPLPTNARSSYIPSLTPASIHK